MSCQILSLDPRSLPPQSLLPRKRFFLKTVFINLVCMWREQGISCGELRTSSPDGFSHSTIWVQGFEIKLTQPSPNL